MTIAFPARIAEVLTHNRNLPNSCLPGDHKHSIHWINLMQNTEFLAPAGILRKEVLETILIETQMLTSLGDTAKNWVVAILRRS